MKLGKDGVIRAAQPWYPRNCFTTSFGIQKHHGTEWYNFDLAELPSPLQVFPTFEATLERLVLLPRERFGLGVRGGLLAEQALTFEAPQRAALRALRWDKALVVHLRPARSSESYSSRVVVQYDAVDLLRMFEFCQSRSVLFRRSWTRPPSCAWTARAAS